MHTYPPQGMLQVPNKVDKLNNEDIILRFHWDLSFNA